MSPKQPYAPVALFVYNRLDHTKETVTALQSNRLASFSELYVFSDGPRNDEDIASVEKVRCYVKSISGFSNVNVIESAENKGLAASIVSGVSFLVNTYGKVIVLEDDIVTSPGFLQYMNDALTLYENEPKVMHVAGYMYPIKKNRLPSTFFYPATSCWGWATWKRAWEHYNPDAAFLYESIKKKGLLDVLNVNLIHDFEGQLRANVEGTLNTWFIKWNASVILCGGYSLYPKYSLVQNIGFDGSGEHCGPTSQFQCPRLAGSIEVKKQRTRLNKRAIVALKEFGCEPNSNNPFKQMKRSMKRFAKKMLKMKR